MDGRRTSSRRGSRPGRLRSACVSLCFAALAAVALPTAAWPCSVCFGAGDPDAAGFAWGVLILLVPVAFVQILLVRFVIRAVRRERLSGGLARLDAGVASGVDGPARGPSVS